MIEIIGICNKIRNTYLKTEYKYGGSPYSILIACNRLKAFNQILTNYGIINYSDISEGDHILIKELEIKLNNLYQ